MAPSIEPQTTSNGHLNAAGITDSMGITQKVSPVAKGGLDSSLLQKSLTSNPKSLPKMEGLVWGTAFSDHMLLIKWNAEEGWLAPEIKEFQNLSLSPAAMVYHYSPALFEGLKAYKSSDGSIRMYRPLMNMERMNRSAARLALPVGLLVAILSLPFRFK